MRHYMRILAISALAAGVVGCDEKLSSVVGPTPDLEPTFSSIQTNIFETTDSAGRTACINCHTNAGGRIPAGNLNLTHDVAYDNLVNRPSVEQSNLNRVTPNNPDASYMVRKVDGTPGITGARMPQNGPPYLTAGQIDVIRHWIELGAAHD